jgi:glycine dehydrogenase subunit 1
MTSYIPHSDEDVRAMLSAVGAASLEELFSDVPKELLLKKDLDIPEGISEEEVLKIVRSFASMNTLATSYLGCGSYDRIIPSAVGSIISLPTFETAYTPYQPEISQGLLQAIFEFQTMICELTGLDVSNASLYDGHTAASEAAAMCFNQRRKSTTFLVSPTVHPFTIQVLKTYFADMTEGEGFKIEVLPEKNGLPDLSGLDSYLDETLAGLLVQSPNIYGIIEDYSGLADKLHAEGALLVISSDPMALGAFKSQGEWGADIAVGDTQPFGLHQAFGGPTAGYMAAREKLLRKMPGRISGETVDVDGKRAFVLTLQAREQHIKRERATSNICSNQALAALATSVYISMAGWAGIQEAADLSYRKAHYLAGRLESELGLKRLFDAPFFDEFTIDLGSRKAAEAFLSSMKERGIFAGVHLGALSSGRDGMIAVAVTEKRTREELDAYVAMAKASKEAAGE